MVFTAQHRHIIQINLHYVHINFFIMVILRRVSHLLVYDINSSTILYILSHLVHQTPCAVVNKRCQGLPQVVQMLRFIHGRKAWTWADIFRDFTILETDYLVC